ncbi:BglG family transcription antiterminator [Paenibacillus rigui]|nr:BglG family transcription antiterminator [Paenibacillus rigui]
MMHVSNRQRQILEMLLSRNGEITASEIASEIKVSVRTVHRELPELEKMLEAYGISLLKKSGSGIRLLADSRSLNELRESLSLTSQAGYSTEERKVLISCCLLESDEPTKLFALAHDLRVAVPTIASDLDHVESWAVKYGLTLVRRRGFGVQLEGPESIKRKVIYLLAKDHLDDSAIFGHTADLPSPSPVTLKLLSMVGKENLMQVEQALWGLEEHGLNELSESGYTDLLLQLSVAVTRIRQGYGIAPTDNIHSGRSVDADADVTALYGRERAMLAHLSNALKLSLSREEAIYISALLRGEKTTATSRLLPQDDFSLMETVRGLIQAMEERCGAPLSEDRSLRDGLLNHLEPALQRIADGERIRNPLLAQIRKNYEQLFSWVRQAADHIFKHIVIPDEEIGFLVMHFGASIERLKQLSRNVKAIIVCTSGIGSSKLLAVRLGKEMPQIEIIDHVSWYEASRIPDGAYDLIISTVDLPLEARQYVKLSPLLTKEEIEKLRHYVQEVTLKKPAEAHLESSYEVQAWELLLLLNRYMHEIIALIEQFEVFPLEPAFMPDGQHTDLRATLHKVCEAVNQDGSLTRIEPVVELLLEREQHGTQVIPDTHLALFHTRSESIRKPVLSMFRLNTPLVLHSEHPAEVVQLVLMLGPLELAKESLEVLSEFSALLLLPELITLLEQGSTPEIKQFLSKELLSFYLNKTEMGRVNQ